MGNRISSTGITQHIVVRFSDTLYEGIDTIQEHKRVIDKKGGVWFGKLGRTLARHKIDILNSQIKGKIRTYLFLVQRIEGEYRWAQAILERVADVVSRKEMTLLPPYYKQHGIVEHSSIWFKVSKLYAPSKSDIQKCYVVSSRRQIYDTLSGSMATMFMVYLGSRDSHRRASRQKVSFETASHDAYEDDEYGNDEYENDEYDEY